MDIQVNHIEGHIAQLTVALDSTTTQAEKRKALRKLSGQIRIPGFRPGKAPQHVIEQKIGKAAILEEIVDNIGNTLYRQALESSQIEPAGMAEIARVEEEDEQLIIVFNVPKRPEVQLPDYQSFRHELVVSEVTDEMVEKALESMREERAVVEEVEREAAIGDQVDLDLYLSWWHEDDHHDHDDDHDHDDAEADEDEDADDFEDEALDLEDEDLEDEDLEDEDLEDEDEPHGHEHVILDEESYKHILREDGDERDLLPGFSAHLIGLKAKDEAEFSIITPDDYANEELAGQKVLVDFMVNSVQSRTLPALNDLFAATVTDGELETLLELRIKVREDLHKEAVAAAEEKLFVAFMDQLYTESSVTYHNASVEDSLDDYIENLSERLREQANMKLDDYLRMMNLKLADLRAQQRENAIDNLKRQATVIALLKQEQIMVKDVEIEAKVDDMLKLFGDQAEQFRGFLDQPHMRDDIAQRLLNDKLVQRVVAIAQGIEPSDDAEAEADHEADNNDEAETETSAD